MTTQFDYDNDQITTNSMIAYNLSLLTNHSVNQYNNLYEENINLNKQIKFLKDDHRYLKKRKLEDENKIEEFQNKIAAIENKLVDKNKKIKITTTEYKITKYKKNKLSFDDDILKRTIYSIKSIKDIINLQDKWINIKHHTQLQKLYLLIKPLKKLDAMVGLNDIKKEVMKKIIYYLQNPNNDEYLHTILAGPPGVGKTEVAKIYAEIFQNLGILKNASFIEVKRDQLVAEYLGQTAPKTRKVLESAMGGVIFIDEAYSLGNPEKRDSFSKECIDMINQYLSEYKNDFMMIIDGYDDELNKCFFSYNPGLRRRFSTYFNIEGYEPNELLEIFKLKLDSFKYVNKIKDNELTKFFKDNIKNFPYFGGDVEKLVNELKYVQANRTFYEDNKDNRDINFIDLNEAFVNFNKNNNKNKDEYIPPMGMYI